MTEGVIDEGQVARARARLGYRDQLRKQRDALLVRLTFEPDRSAELRSAVRSLTTRLEAFAEVDDQVGDAERELEAKRLRATSVHGHRLAEILHRLHDLEVEDAELQRVQRDAYAASDALVRAEVALSSALATSSTVSVGTRLGMRMAALRSGTWSERSEDAVFALREAERHLQALSNDLGRRGTQAGALLRLGAAPRTIDALLGLPGGDVDSHQRLGQAHAQVRELQQLLTQLLVHVDRRRDTATHERRTLQDERHALGGTG